MSALQIHMKIIPLTLRQANEFVTQYHKHNKKAQGCKFCIGVQINNELQAVAIVGRPLSRQLDNGLTAEILRLCTKQNGIKNLCSFLYSKCWKIWKLMGGMRIITYTLEEESASSLKASGFIKTSETKPFPKGKGWTTRKNRVWQQIQSQKRIRWEYNFVRQDNDTPKHIHSTAN